MEFVTEAAQTENTSLQERDMKLSGCEEVKFVSKDRRQKRGEHRTCEKRWDVERLIIGAKSLQNPFDEAMYRIFGDFRRGCLNQQDDILIRGRKY